MSESNVPAPAPAAAAPRPSKVRKFEAPAELDPKFGVTFQSEDHIAGLVKTEDVRALLDAFGLDDRKEITFPWQYIRKRAGEQWRMRIESADYHTVDGVPTLAHAWNYTLDVPERISGAV